MTRDQVKQNLRTRGLTYYELGKKWGVTASMVAQLINGRAKSARLERLLALALKVKVKTLPQGDQAA